MALALLGALATGGCAGIGLAAVNPVLSALSIVADRSVERTLPTDLNSGWTATTEALGRMGVAIREADRSGERWVMRAEGGTITVLAELTPVTPSMTKLVMTVEAGRIGADKQTAEAIVNQVAASLAKQRAGAGEASAAERVANPDGLAVLEGEIRQLRMEIERSRTARNSTVERGPGPRFVPGVTVVPDSYGVPALPAPAKAALTPVDRRQNGAAPAIAAETPPVESRTDEIVAGSLSPVHVLSPVLPLTSGRSTE